MSTIPVIQHRFCAANCNKGFASIILGLNYVPSPYIPPPNYLVEGSITSCINPDIESTVFIHFGQTLVSSTNISRNTAKSCPAYFMWADRDTIGKTNFSSFERNRGSVIIEHNGAALFEYCNVLGNNRQDDKGTTFSCVLTKSATVSKCCFFGNSGNGKLFSAYESTVIIRDCQIDNCTTSERTATFDIQNIGNKFSLNSLTFFTTFLCRNIHPSQNCKGFLHKFACMLNISIMQVTSFIRRK